MTNNAGLIWLIGSKGMLGTELSLLLEKSGIPFAGTDREVDITVMSALTAACEKLAGKQPVKWIINCAAYTAVDKAEDDAETCRSLNEHGAANIASVANNIEARLIHISTDYVFDGTASRPYREDDATAPTGVYGLTKRDGEIAVLKNNTRSYIIRTAWLYGKHGNNFVHTMLRLMNERSEIKVVNDQRGSPTWAFDLAFVILTLIKKVDYGKNIPFGIYHFTNDGNITWFDFAKEIFRQGRKLGGIAKDCAVNPCTSAEYPAKVKRPAYSVLDKRKIKSALGIKIPAWKKSLKEFLKKK
ncbi:MAG: dTDP-4-dehydrorhamnose reductase [Treponema sp.]|jgi:dTDP-4-dehydrorhamnose reductase|nr:dTDP-4-dehydrorhamnose reductase [Treponema sp.]